MSKAKRTATDEAAQPVDGADCQFILDMNPSEFLPLQKKFVADLAKLLDTDAKNIEILGVYFGCTIVHLRLPKEALDRLKQLDWSSDQSMLVQALATSFKVSRISTSSSGPTIVVKLRSEGQEVTWLHLSDAHVKAAGSKGSWGQDVVRKKFVSQLPDLLAAEELHPDFVFFTGDVAFSGKPEEYQVARDLLGTIIDSTGAERRARLVCVPGNHDVDREQVLANPDAERSASGLLRSNESVINFFQDTAWKECRQRVFGRLDGFMDFAKRCRSYGQPEMNESGSFVYRTQLHGRRIAIAGLNSAWRSSSDSDRGNLIIGPPQLNDAVNQLTDCSLRFALVHHPVESPWYLHFDRSYQRSIFPEFDFVLTGHEHDAVVHDREFRHFFAGALHTSDEEGNSFNVVRINLTTGESCIYYWHFVDKKLEWRVDNSVHPSGVQEFQLPEKVMARAAIAESALAQAAGG